MTKREDMTLGNLIDCVPVDYAWLLRSDSERGFFCHIFHVDTVAILGLGMVGGGGSFKVYADTPEEAFRQALAAMDGKSL